MPEELGTPRSLAELIIKEASEDAPKSAAAPETQTTVPAFRSIQVDVANAGVTFVCGDAYDVQIDYPDGMPLPTVELRGRTLFIQDPKTRRGLRRFSFNNWRGGQIRITLPGGSSASYETFHIETANGAITLPALAIEDVHCAAVNGEISLSGVMADRLRCGTVNGGIKLTACYAHQSAHCETVNGGIVLTGELRGKTHAETVNGGLRIESVLPITAYNLDLDAVSGGVYIDDEKHRKSVHISHQAENTIQAKTVNGSIKLGFCK